MQCIGLDGLLNQRSKLRYLAIKIISDLPHRYRLIRQALTEERTDFPKSVILSLDVLDYVSVITVRLGFCGLLVTDQSKITVLSGEP